MESEDTINFYDSESSQYTKKRYDGKTESYFQFLFKRRRQILLGFIGSLKPVDWRLLEIGCADGVLLKKLVQKFPEGFKSLVGIDISPKMIDKAIETTKNPIVTYHLRDEEKDSESKYDLILELGVHVYNLEEEMLFVSKKLPRDRYFIYSAASRNSIHARIKLKDKEYLKDYMSYDGYEKILRKYFRIVSSKPYGLFIPKLWAFPALARIVQPIVDALLRNVIPSLFHEKIYLLIKR